MQTSNKLNIHQHPYRGNKLVTQGRRDDMPPGDGSLTHGRSTFIRGRVRSVHISGGWPAAGSQRADSQGSQHATA